MSRVDPKTLLYALILAVPIVVGGAGLASFLLLRAGYGPLVWIGAPLGAMLLTVVVLGLILGRAAGGSLPGGRGHDGDRGGDKGAGPGV